MPQTVCYVYGWRKVHCGGHSKQWVESWDHYEELRRVHDQNCESYLDSAPSGAAKKEPSCGPTTAACLRGDPSLMHPLRCSPNCLEDPLLPH